MVTTRRQDGIGYWRRLGLEINLYKQFREIDFILRDPSSHNQHCLEIENTTEASREYGVNRDSILNELW